jgi:precorrin-2/cobalt-factor-2 C20-methyltransferase
MQTRTTSTITAIIMTIIINNPKNSATTGVFYGVGVGPGDPELITRKAARILSEADWIFFPSGARSKTSLALQIVEPLELARDKLRDVSLGMSADRRQDQETYRRAVAEIVAELRQGKSVAWITEGDPLFYSTFVNLLEEMQRHHPEVKIEIVPGVTSVSAAAARASVPVSRLNEKVAIFPAVYGLDRLPELIADFDTVFLVKVSSVLDQLLEKIDRQGEPIRAVYVEKVGTPEERLVSDLRSLKGQELSYFSVVILRRERVASERKQA